MATNSKREQILDYHENTIIAGMSSITKVIRTMPNYETLQQFANTQFPVCAIVGKLPRPVEKISSRHREQVDQIRSELDIDNYIYLIENETPDTELSNIADDLWAALYSDPTYGGLTISVSVVPDVDTAYWAPYVAFKITSVVSYVHGIGGI